MVGAVSRRWHVLSSSLLERALVLWFLPGRTERKLCLSGESSRMGVLKKINGRTQLGGAVLWQVNWHWLTCPRH